MQTIGTNAAMTQGKSTHAEPGKFSKRIGSTVYTVAIHFSQTSKETAQDKLRRLIEHEVHNNAS